MEAFLKLDLDQVRIISFRFTHLIEKNGKNSCMRDRVRLKQLPGLTDKSLELLKSRRLGGGMTATDGVGGGWVSCTDPTDIEKICQSIRQLPGHLTLIV